jgi:hypothetical protein
MLRPLPSLRFFSLFPLPGPIFAHVLVDSQCECAWQMQRRTADQPGILLSAFGVHLRAHLTVCMCVAPALAQLSDTDYADVRALVSVRPTTSAQQREVAVPDFAIDGCNGGAMR